MNDNGYFREYIVDLAADPGTLIPSDAAESHLEYDDSVFSTSPLSRDVDSSRVASSSSWVGSSFEEQSERRYKSRNLPIAEKEFDDRPEFLPSTNLTRSIKDEESSMMSDDFGDPCSVKKGLVREIPSRPIQPYMHTRSPSWTEGISSPAARRMKVKDVSKYMIDAAKENPHLAQKLHDVLLESGVVAPPNLFSEMYSGQLNVSMDEAKSPPEDSKTSYDTQKTKESNDLNYLPLYLPPLPHLGLHSKDSREGTVKPVSFQLEETPRKYVRNVPVAAAAAAAAAVVASSMIVAAAKTTADSSLEIPVAAAATATAAAVMATTAAVGKQCENIATGSNLPSGEAFLGYPMDGTRSDVDSDAAVHEPQGSDGQKHDSSRAFPEGERVSDRSAGNDSTRSDVSLDDVMDCEIPWEDLTLGERIGLGTYL